MKHFVQRVQKLKNSQNKKHIPTKNSQNMKKEHTESFVAKSFYFLQYGIRIYYQELIRWSKSASNNQISLVNCRSWLISRWTCTKSRQFGQMVLKIKVFRNEGSSNQKRLPLQLHAIAGHRKQGNIMWSLILVWVPVLFLRR